MIQAAKFQDRQIQGFQNQEYQTRHELADLLPQASFVRNRAIAVLLPCLNEEATIGQVVTEFRTVLPGATV